MDRDQLLRVVRDRADDETPLALVRSAVQVSEDVSSVADSVVSHFVDEARAAGHSWTEIGHALGVSKQAVHQKFVKQAVTDTSGVDRWPGFSRFTDRARKSLHVAQNVALDMNHNFLGTEHMLLGLAADPDGLAGKALASFGITEAAIRARVEELIGRGPTRPSSPPPFTPRAKVALEGTIGHALRLGHNYVGTEHLLLSVYAMKEGVAYNVLKSLGVKKKSDLEARILGLIASTVPPPVS